MMRKLEIEGEAKNGRTLVSQIEKNNFVNFFSVHIKHNHRKIRQLHSLKK